VNDVPLVSICLPTYNGQRFIGAALDSIAAQDYPRIEVIAVDDGSTDATPDRLRAWRERPLRLVVHRRNRGHNATWNESVSRSSGAFVKFLHQDDELRPDCVTRMVTAIERAPTAGLVFSRRRVVFDDLSPQEARRWLELAGRLDEKFGGLAPVNRGCELLARWAAAGCHENWIGEPSAVMVRRSALATAGLFAHHVIQATDMELWARIMARHDVCFIDDELAVFRVSTPSLSFVNRRTRRAWLDRLWLFESLAHDAETAAMLPELAALLQVERRQAFRSSLRLGRLRDGSRVPLRPYLRYTRFRVLTQFGSRRPPYARLPGEAAPRSSSPRRTPPAPGRTPRAQ
jgi:glycosyltransferase involved in cell wall biosynthesis